MYVCIYIYIYICRNRYGTQSHGLHRTYAAGFRHAAMYVCMYVCTYTCMHAANSVVLHTKTECALLDHVIRVHAHIQKYMYLFVQASNFLSRFGDINHIQHAKMAGNLARDMVAHA